LFIVVGPELGPELEGKRLIIVKSLYGLRTSGARFHEHLSAKIRLMGYQPTKADPDLWMKRHVDGHYEYLARYVDDVISFSKDPLSVMKELEKCYVMKGVGKPQYYLGGDVVELDDQWEKEGITHAFAAETYIEQCIPKLLRMLNVTQFPKKNVPLNPEYHPELDETPLISEERITHYRSLIGSANWILTLGRFDIAYALSSLSRYSMAPREGHIQALQHLFGYLKAHNDGKILIDIGKTPIREQATISDGFSWSEFYQDTSEDVPLDMPEPKGGMMRLTCYVDADHARDKVTRRSVTGIILMVNNTPVTWISKRQKTVETSTYGSELVASRIAVDLLIEWRYKLRMLGIPIEDQSWLVGDNMAVILNTTLPSSSIKKKHLACNYHRVREAIAGGFLIFGHIDTKLNLADMCTKPLAVGILQPLLNMCLFRKPKTLIKAKQL